MKRFRIVVCLSTLTALTLLLPACKNSGNGNANANNGKKIKVAFITNNPHNFWKFAESGCIKAQEELNAKGMNVEVIFKMPPNGTASEQRQMVEDLKVQGVQAIAISPNNVDQQIDFFYDINEKIPLIMVDSDVGESNPENFDARRCYLGTNNVAAGKSAGELLKEATPDGKFIIFVGKLDVLNAVQRREGVVTSLAGGKDKCKPQLAAMQNNKYPIKFGTHELLDTRTDDASRTKCRQEVDDMLTLHPDLKAMVGLWAYNPPEILEGVKKVKRDVKIVGFDEDEATLQGISDGDIIGTVVQDPFTFGRLATHLMVALAQKDEAFLKSKEYKLGDQTFTLDEHNRIYVKHRVIKKDDVPEFRKELKENLSHVQK